MQYNGEDTVNYSFCTSESMILVKESVELNSGSQTSTGDTQLYSCNATYNPDGLSADSSSKEEDSMIDGEKFGFNLTDFKRFLSSSESLNGKRYSPSSINVYAGSLKSDYITGMAKRYISNGNIFEISNRKDLYDLYADVLEDTEHGVKSRSYALALKLYLQFTKLVGRGEYTLTTSQERISISRREDSKSSIARKVAQNGKLKRIITRDFSLSGDTPPGLMVDFVERIGPDKVYNLHIPYLGGFLVETSRNRKYISASKYLTGGYWINTCSSTSKKIEQLEEIARRLGIDIKFITE